MTAAENLAKIRKGKSVISSAKTFSDMQFRRDKAYAHVEGHAAAGRLPLHIKLAYTAPTMSTLPIVVLLAVYMNVFYEKLGASLTYISLFIALARSLDVITDPLMSYLTDSCRSKQGRRRPFIATGCVPYGLFLFLLCTPTDGLSGDMTAMWFGCFYIMFYVMNTYSNIPYDALGPELTDNYEDRSRLFFISGLFDGFGTILTITTPVGFSLLLKWNSIINDSSCDVVSRNATNGVHTSAWDGRILSTVTLDNLGCSPRWTPIGGTQEFIVSAHESNISWYNATACTDLIGVKNGIDPSMRQFCECRDVCTQQFAFGHERTAFSIVGAGFAGWYIVTSIICVCCIKERSQLNGGESLPKPTPLVPSMLNTFNNKPFVMLLPAWACDAVCTGIVASMVSYFVRYVVEPEFQPGCLEGLASHWQCSSLNVTGLSVTCMLFCAFIFTPLWLALAGKLGKRKTWLIWSMTMACTNALYIFVSSGTIWLNIAVSGINGMPFGAKFLADAILADIIDYDEFLTGSRSEATYTMFKSFLPKICAIPAAAIPLALLNVFGHISPVNGRIMKQPAAIKAYCQVVTVVLPTLASLVATYFKWKFPLKTKEQCEAISKGVGKHMQGKAAPEPVTGINMKLQVFTDDELEKVQILDAFRGVRIVEDLLKDAPATVEKNVAASKKKLVMAVVMQIVATTCVWLTNFFKMIEDPKLSLFPVLGIIWFGISLTAVAFNILKLKNAKALARNIPSKSVLERVLEQRVCIKEVMAAMTSGKKDETSQAQAQNRGGEDDASDKDSKKSSINNADNRDKKKKSTTKVVPATKAGNVSSDEMTFAERKAVMEEELNNEDEPIDDSYDDMGRGAEGKWMI